MTILHGYQESMCPRAHSASEIDYGTPFVMRREEIITELALNQFGLSPTKDQLREDCFLVLHPGDERPGEGEDRVVLRFHKRDFTRDSVCVVSIEELAVLEIISGRSLRPDLRGWRFQVTPLHEDLFRVQASR